MREKRYGVNQMRKKYKILLDTSALLSGLNSPNGASALILSLFQIGNIEVRISAHIVIEARAVIKRKFPLLKDSFTNFLLHSPRNIKKFSNAEIHRALHLINTEDTPILALALKTKPDFVITLDKRFEMLLKEILHETKEDFQVMNPGKFIEWYKQNVLAN